MSKKILFPFLFDKDFHRGYSWSMELADRMDATVCFFTSVPAENNPDTGVLKNIYHALLEARGNYVRQYYYSQPDKALAKSERCIEEGEFNGTLLNLLKKTRFDLVVVDPQASLIANGTLQKVVDNSDGVIVLPQQDDIDNSLVTGDGFYSILQRSELHKLPGGFFKTLGKDKTLFNFLRGFFRKHDRPAASTGL